jgi:GNAT superfamily N-acetyltransferase
VNEVVEVVDGVERSQLCESVLRALPEWFGLEHAIKEYVAQVVTLPTLAVRDDAFLSLKRHGPRAAEVYVMGVRPARHGQGLGTALMQAAETYLRAERVEYLQVKTLGPSNPSQPYARTRRFYERCGFVALEEIHGLWDEWNPCLIMVKRL